MPQTLDVLYLDNHLLVINKPPGLLAQADETGDPDVLTIGKAYLKDRFDKPGKVFLGLVHRLDRPASGVMALARTSKSAARLSEQFRNRTPEKTYLALVEGHLERKEEYVDFLLKDDRTVRVVDPDTEGAAQAVLNFEIGAKGSWRGRPVTLVEIHLKTGRAHQIRVQFASRGFPLVGDLRYGATLEFDGRNLALHAVSLTLDHPTRDERMIWKAAPPEIWGDDYADDIARILSELRAV